MMKVGFWWRIIPSVRCQSLWSLCKNDRGWLMSEKERLKLTVVGSSWNKWFQDLTWWAVSNRNPAYGPQRHMTSMIWVSLEWVLGQAVSLRKFKQVSICEELCEGEGGWFWLSLSVCLPVFFNNENCTEVIGEVVCRDDMGNLN